VFRAQYMIVEANRFQHTDHEGALDGVNCLRCEASPYLPCTQFSPTTLVHGDRKFSAIYGGSVVGSTLLVLYRTVVNMCATSFNVK
jgi:hypothetical protein